MSKILEQYSVSRISTLPENLHILAFDLGRKTGFTHRTKNQSKSYCIQWMTESEEAKLRKQGADFEVFDPRVVEMAAYVDRYMRDLPTDSELAVAWEQVQFATYRLQIQLWTSFRAALWMACSSATTSVEMTAVPVGELKKFAGKGNFGKPEMRLAAVQRGLIPPTIVDDNLIDSLWLAEFIASKY